MIIVCGQGIRRLVSDGSGWDLSDFQIKVPETDFNLKNQAVTSRKEFLGKIGDCSFFKYIYSFDFSHKKIGFNA